MATHAQRQHAGATALIKKNVNKKTKKPAAPSAVVARTTRCPGSRGLVLRKQEVAGKVRTSAVTSCAPTEVSVGAPGQQVVRATHEAGAAGRTRSEALRDYWRDVKSGKRVRNERPAELPKDPAANPLFLVPDGQRAKLFVLLRDCPLLETVNAVLRSNGVPEVNNDQLVEFLDDEAEQYWDLRTRRADNEANSLVRLAEKNLPNISTGILTALGQAAFKQVIRDEIEPGAMSRIVTMFLKARSEKRADQMQGLKRRKAENDLGDDAHAAFRKLAEEVDRCPAAQEHFDALQRALAENAEEGE
jgi:hypothetical protein